jgi:hypothetical protein
MERDNFKTDVIFRVVSINKISEVTALFPHNVADSNGHISCYAHQGQHGSANYKYCVSKGRLATETEYKELKSELESLGYDLNVIKKQNYDKYLAEYRNPKRIWNSIK